MNAEKIAAMEVKASSEGWYYVSLFQYKKEEEKDPDYFNEWLFFDGKEWDYSGYKDCCYVCFLHKKEG